MIRHSMIRIFLIGLFVAEVCEPSGSFVRLYHFQHNASSDLVLTAAELQGVVDSDAFDEAFPRGGPEEEEPNAQEQAPQYHGAIPQSAATSPPSLPGQTCFPARRFLRSLIYPDGPYHPPDPA